MASTLDLLVTDEDYSLYRRVEDHGYTMRHSTLAHTTLIGLEPAILRRITHLLGSHV